jgi:hypothetical protein
MKILMNWLVTAITSVAGPLIERWFLKVICGMAAAVGFNNGTVPPPAQGVNIAGRITVWWRGVGTGFPLASLITASIAFSNLNKNGITSWDRDCGCQISHSPISGPRWIAIYAAVASMLVLTIAGASS